MQYKITVYHKNHDIPKDVYENVKDFWHKDNWFIIKFLNGESFYINTDIIASIAVTRISIFEEDEDGNTKNRNKL